MRFIVCPRASRVLPSIPPRSAQATVGVRQSFTAASSPTCTFFPLWYAVRPRQSVTCATERPPFGQLGVGHNPDSFSSVRGTGIDSSQHSPSRIIPHRGQVSAYASESSSSESWGVFHEHEARSHLANGSCHLGPESAALSVESFAGSGDADVLARKAASDDIHHATPRLSVEGADVVPDRERRERAVVLTGAEHASGVVVDFDGAHSAPAEQLAAEYSTSSACE
jgi:hypothetical protein